jgi:inner membrane protein
MENMIDRFWNRNRIVLKSFWIGFLILIRPRRLSCAQLSVQYGFVYTLIQLQDYALLMGSVGLFLTLALVMYFSRKIKWNAV